MLSPGRARRSRVCALTQSMRRSIARSRTNRTLHACEPAIMDDGVFGEGVNETIMDVQQERVATLGSDPNLDARSIEEGNARSNGEEHVQVIIDNVSEEEMPEDSCHNIPIVYAEGDFTKVNNYCSSIHLVWYPNVSNLTL